MENHRAGGVLLRWRLTRRRYSGENRISAYAGVTQLVECDLAKVDVASSNLVSRSIPFFFKASAFLSGSSESLRQVTMKKLFALTAISAALLSAQYKSSPGVKPSPDVPAVLAGELAPGFQVADASGKAYCEFWFRKLAPSGPKMGDDAVTLQTVPQGSFMGVIRFDADGFDRRGQKLKAGVYSLRYAWMPVSGDHQGAAPQRDFVVMIPVADDADPKVTLSATDVLEKSRKASGTPHPAILSVASAIATEGFAKDGDHDWTLTTKLGDQLVSVILVGKAEN